MDQAVLTNTTTAAWATAGHPLFQRILETGARVALRLDLDPGNLDITYSGYRIEVRGPYVSMAQREEKSSFAHNLDLERLDGIMDILTAVREMVAEGDEAAEPAPAA